MTTWNFDPSHSVIEFSVRHMMLSTVKGTFSGLSGNLQFDASNPANSSIEASVDVSTVNTGVGDRDAHLRSADFFDAENFPKLSFKSTKIDVTGDNTGKVTGDLTIRGTTKEVTFDVDFFGEGKSPFGDHRAGFAGSTRIDREAWGLTWNQALEAGGVLVSKDVKISIELQAVAVTEAADA